jgi:ABC-type Fe3+ transport system substrate-binding protein
MKRIQAEAANPGGDIFWSGGVGTLAAFPDLMEPYQSPEAKAIAPQFHDAKGRYIGVNVHVMVLMVNEKQLKGLAAPKTWSDLMKPEWKGKVTITDPSQVRHRVHSGLWPAQAVWSRRPGENRRKCCRGAKLRSGVQERGSW